MGNTKKKKEASESQHYPPSAFLGGTKSTVPSAVGTNVSYGEQILENIRSLVGTFGKILNNMVVKPAVAGTSLLTSCSGPNCLNPNEDLENTSSGTTDPPWLLKRHKDKASELLHDEEIIESIPQDKSVYVDSVWNDVIGCKQQKRSHYEGYIPVQRMTGSPYDKWGRLKDSYADVLYIPINYDKTNPTAVIDYWGYSQTPDTFFVKMNTRDGWDQFPEYIPKTWKTYKKGGRINYLNLLR